MVSLNSKILHHINITQNGSKNVYHTTYQYGLWVGLPFNKVTEPVKTIVRRLRGQKPKPCGLAVFVKIKPYY